MPTTERGSTAFALRVFAFVGGALTVVVALAPFVWPRGEAPARPHMIADRVLGNWLWWDGAWYLQIAQHGYSYHPHQQSSVAFFPLYPLVVRTLSWLVPVGTPLAAIAVTALSGAVALTLFHRWCARRMSPAAARTAVVLLAVYPYAWFLYGAAYSDALFLSLVLGAFLVLEDDHPVWAGVLGALATAARPTGVAVLVGLVAVALHRRIAGHRRGAGVLLAASGLGLWCAWLAVRFGNPFAFIETEGAPGWNQAPGLHTWLKVELVKNVTRGPVTGWVRLVPQAMLCAAFLAALPGVLRLFGWGYATFVAVAVALPALSTSDFMGAGRYLLLAFPVFAIVGEHVADRPLARPLIIGASSGLLVLTTSLFASGYLLT